MREPCTIAAMGHRRTFGKNKRRFPDAFLADLITREEFSKKVTLTVYSDLPQSARTCCGPSCQPERAGRTSWFNYSIIVQMNITEVTSAFWMLKERSSKFIEFYYSNRLFIDYSPLACLLPSYRSSSACKLFSLAQIFGKHLQNADQQLVTSCHLVCT